MKGYLHEGNPKKDALMNCVKTGTSRLRDVEIDRAWRFPYIEDTLKVFNGAYTFDHAFYNALYQEALDRKLDYINSFRSRRGRGFKYKLTIEDVARLLYPTQIFKNVIVSNINNDEHPAAWSEHYMLRMYDNDPASRDYGLYVSPDAWVETYVKLDSSERPGPYRNKILEELSLISETVKRNADRGLYAVLNGIYDVESGVLMDYHPDCIFLKKVYIDYKADLECPAVDGWLLKLAGNNEDVVDLYWQVIAEVLQVNVSRHQAIILHADGDISGRNTFRRLLLNLVDKHTTFAIEDFIVANQTLGSLLDSAVNIGGQDVTVKHLEQRPLYVDNIIGNNFEGRERRGVPVQYSYDGANVQMATDLPEFQDASMLKERLVIVPFYQEAFEIDVESEAVLAYVLSRTLERADFEKFVEPEIVKKHFL